MCPAAFSGLTNSAFLFAKRPQSITRGIGPSRQSLPLDLSSVWNEGPPSLSDTEGVPVGGKYLIIAGGFFCTREIELSLALRRHISFDTDSKRFTWNLPCSKTDPRAIGKFPSWDCVCGEDFGKPCAFQALLLHCRRLDERLADRRHWEDLPLSQTRTVARRDVVRLIEQAATRLGLAAASPQGSRLFGGHALRVSWAQWLARSGVELPLIHLMARWSSDVIARYVAQVPSKTISTIHKNEDATGELRVLLDDARRSRDDSERVLGEI